mmetsp:Transcript_13874/g.20232  ORF Transcript_13874/g.20232 Transcript_13874/m.20232 type:complete len:83 (+) Transcript_13874:678-926(+)
MRKSHVNEPTDIGMEAKLPFSMTRNGKSKTPQTPIPHRRRWIVLGNSRRGCCSLSLLFPASTKVEYTQLNINNQNMNQATPG